MRTFAVVLCFGAVAAHFSFPDAEKFKPMISACESKDKLANCSSVFHGVCKTGHDGSRFCKTCGHHDHKHHGFWHEMHEMKKMLGFHHDDKHHGHWKHVGDCDANKLDGDACKVDRPGQCIPSGKCPVFHGEMVCRPNDAHPPKFVTEPCEGKKEGDDCKHLVMPGKCTKPKYMDDMYCKVSWPSKEEVGSVLSGLSTVLAGKVSESPDNSTLLIV